MSNEYLSALDVSHDSSSPSQCSGASPKKPKIDSTFVPMAEDNIGEPATNQTDNDIFDDAVDKVASPPKILSLSQPEVSQSKPNIPPAFANFLDNLSKKRPRSTPKSLPVKSLYSRERMMNGNARYLSHLPKFSLEKKSEGSINSNLFYIVLNKCFPLS